jgi:monothiol glutaredoxin
MGEVMPLTPEDVSNKRFTPVRLREGVKSYSNWPTIPQLYVKGEFVGGCDIIREMFQAGELRDLLKNKGVAVKESASA